MKKRIERKLARAGRRHARQTMKVVVHQVRPEPGDFVVLQLPENIPQRQLQAFRRQFYATQAEKGIKGSFAILSASDVSMRRFSSPEAQAAIKLITDELAREAEPLTPPPSEGVTSGS